MKVRALIPLLLFVALALLFLGNLDRNTRLIPSPLIDKSAPDFRLPQLNVVDTFFTPRDLKGRPWLLNVWASWCAACQKEHPLLNRLAREKHILMVGLNYKDQSDNALAWLNKRGNPYDVVAVDHEGKAGLDWGVYGVPETFLIDANGIIRFKHVGPIDSKLIQQKILPFFDDKNNI